MGRPKRAVRQTRVEAHRMMVVVLGMRVEQHLNWELGRQKRLTVLERKAV
jgi:hypothetical protein